MGGEGVKGGEQRGVKLDGLSYYHAHEKYG